MSNRVAFIDTSVLLNLVPVPGRAQNETEVIEEYKSRQGLNQQFILPMTSVIETGNFIAQIQDGSLRRQAASRFAQLLGFVAAGKAPFVLNALSWDKEFITSLLAGASTGITYIEHAQNKVGAGDLCILTERDEYQTRSKIEADVWTLDVALGAHV